MDDLIKLEEAAKFLKCSTKSVEKWRKSENLPYIKIGRSVLYSKKELEKWVYSRLQTR